MQLYFDDSQVKGLAALWKRAPEIMREEMLPAVTSYDQLVAGELRQQLPRGAGGLQGGAGLVGSIFTEEVALADNVLGMAASNLPYAEPVEVGTRPHFPPIQPIADWVQAKLGIDDEKERNSVAFLIARKISIKGTKPDGTWARVAESTEPAGVRLIAEGVERVLDRLGAPA